MATFRMARRRALIPSACDSGGPHTVSFSSISRCRTGVTTHAYSYCGVPTRGDSSWIEYALCSACYDDRHRHDASHPATPGEE